MLKFYRKAPNIQEITLNPTNFDALPDLHQELLNSILLTRKQVNHSVIIPAGLYTIRKHGIKYQVNLTHPLAPRSRGPKIGSDGKESEVSGSRIEVLDGNHIGWGIDAQIYPSLGALKPEDHYRFKAKDPGKQRICKKYIPKKSTNPRGELQPDYPKFYASMARYKQAPKLPHLRCKRHEVGSVDAMLVMRRMPGVELFTLVDKGGLNLNQRLLLIRNCLIALRDQVHRHKLIHRDLKLENIMVDITDGKMEVNIVDGDFVIPENATVNNLVGTPEYLDPVITSQAIRQREDPKLPIEYSYTNDVYAMGLVVSEICGERGLIDLKVKRELDSMHTFHIEREPMGLFEGLELGDDLRKSLTELIRGMTTIYATQRWTLDQAIEEIEAIVEEYVETSTPGPTPG